MRSNVYHEQQFISENYSKFACLLEVIGEIEKFCFYFLQKEKLLKDQAQAELKSDKKLPTGALVKLHGLKDGLSLSALKKKLTEEFEWNVGFVDYTAGEPNAYVRLQEENSAKDVCFRHTSE